MDVNVKPDIKDEEASLSNEEEEDIMVMLKQRFKNNYRALRLYHATVQPRTAHITNIFDHAYIPGHPLKAFSSKWDGSLSSNYFEQFPYKSLLPKMINQVVSPELNDPVSDLIYKKYKWRRKICAAKKTANNKDLYNKFEQLNEEVVRCPKLLVDIARLNECDPDQYFNSHYNWYYTGNGNLQLICINWVDYLLHSEFNVAYLSEFSQDKLYIKHNTTKFDCGEGNHIFETICSINNIIALRTKYIVFILKIISNNDSIHLEQLDKMESEIPYTGISFDAHHTNILYVSTLDQRLIIVNLDRMRCRTMKLHGKMDALENNWNTVFSSDRYNFSHITTTYIKHYDKRTNKPVQVYKDIPNISDLPHCAQLCMARQRELCDSLYVATAHHLFVVDRRLNRAVRRWTHGCLAAPTGLLQCDDAGRDLLCLNTQWCEDTCLVSTSGERGGISIPYRLPSLYATMNEGFHAGLCFSLSKNVVSRLCTSITGTVVYESAGSCAVLTQNSLGDVSCHSLHSESTMEFLEDDAPRRLHDWIQTYEKTPEVFEVTSLEDFSGIWKKLRRLRDDLRQIGSDNQCSLEEADVVAPFESGDIDRGLLDAWQTARPPADSDAGMDFFQFEDD